MKLLLLVLAAFATGSTFTTAPSAISSFLNTQGFGPVVFNFTTSALSEYASSDLQQIRITLVYASFNAATDCADVVGATGGLPSLRSCLFTTKEALLSFQSSLTSASTYSMTIQLSMPSLQLPDVSLNQNWFTLSTEYVNGTVIERSSSLLLSPYVYTSASVGGASASNGWITDFSLVSMSAYVPFSAISFVFAMSTLGTMNNRFSIAVFAQPPNLWDFGTPGTPCIDYTTLRLVSGSTCTLANFAGAASSSVSNGFLISITAPSAVALSGAQFKVSIGTGGSTGGQGALGSLNAKWVAQSFRTSPPSDLNTSPQSAMLTTSIAILGVVTGGVTDFSFPLISSNQVVRFEVSPGNTVIPSRSGVGGQLILTGPTGFVVQNVMSSFNATWSTSGSTCTAMLSTYPAFGDTSYTITLLLTNPTTVSGPYAWSARLLDSSGNSLLAASNRLRGLSLVSSLTADLQYENRLLGADNRITFTITPSVSLGRAINTRIRVRAPNGYLFSRKCSEFSTPISCSCRGYDNQLLLIFSEQNILQSNVPITFSIAVVNPHSYDPNETSLPTVSANVWVFSTETSDSVTVNIGRVIGWDLYASPLSAFSLGPVSRLSGSQLATFSFTPSEEITAGYLLLIECPSGVSLTGGFTAVGWSSSNALLGSLGNNLTVTVSGPSLAAGTSYSFVAGVLVPSLTPIVNVWWLNVLDGDGFLSSSSADGFATQALTNIQLVPYNPIVSAWNNPISVTFTTTADALTVPGSIAEFDLSAPAGFSFICPTESYLASPYYATLTGSDILDLPSDTQCVVSTSAQNILRLLFPLSGLKASKQYAFIVHAANPATATGNFVMSTHVGSVLVESGSVSVFGLAASMSTTTYFSVPSKEDRRALSVSNTITLVLGVKSAVPAGGQLIISAPLGFSLARNAAGLCSVGPAGWMGGSYAVFPSDSLCNSPVGFPNVAQVTIPGGLSINTYAAAVLAANPASTPVFNYWSVLFTANDVPLMGTYWMQGFVIQAITSVSIYPYNPSAASMSAQAQNLLNVTFATTTTVPINSNDVTGGLVVMKASSGFTFPVLCDDFKPWGLPASTTCEGDGARTVVLSLPEGSSLSPGSYGFAVSVLNPAAVTSEAPVWSLWTAATDNSIIDSNVTVPAFRINQPFVYFSVSSLSNHGDDVTSIRISFSLTGGLPPQKALIVNLPAEFDLTSAGASGNGGACASNGLSILQSFPISYLTNTAQLPPYVNCTISGTKQITILNTDPVRKGRLMLPGSIYQVPLQGVRNPSITPSINYWQAFSSSSLGDESATVQGYKIASRLLEGSVTSSNPGIGLFTIFTFSLSGITDVPFGGAITVTAPSNDYYFGERLVPAFPDPLAVTPPTSGNPVELLASEANACIAYISGGSLTCPFTFSDCLNAPSSAQCLSLTSRCLSGDLVANDVGGAILACTNENGKLTLNLGPEVALSSGRVFDWSVSGYNGLIQSDNDWLFETRGNDASQSVLDSLSVSGFKQLGVVYVESIVPSGSQVSLTGNLVSVNFKLAHTLTAPNQMRVTYPSGFVPAGNTASVQLSGAFPSSATSQVNGYEILITSSVAIVPKNSELILRVTLSNPAVSPPASANVWHFESFVSGNPVDVNFDVSGFQIFGAFKNAAIAPVSKSPGVQTKVGIWFSLDSDLSWSQSNPSSFLNISFPAGFGLVDSTCGQDIFEPSFIATSGAEVNLPSGRIYRGIPVASECRSDIVNGQLMISVALDGALTYGTDYAFTIGVINPSITPETNTLKFFTRLDGVVFHLMEDVDSYAMRSLKTAQISVSDAHASVVSNQITFTLQSTRAIPGGSLVTVTAPVGFILTCQGIYFTNLAQTTSCAIRAPNIAQLFIPVSAGLVASTLFGFTLTVRNPAYTPQPNQWSFAIETSQGVALDVANNLPGFDIVGTLVAVLSPQLTYKNHRQTLTMSFTPSTIMNRALSGNALIVHAPTGFVFPATCSGYTLVPSVDQSADLSSSCQGFGNNTLIVTFPEGSGLHRGSYTLTVSVKNAASNVNGTLPWTVMTALLDGQTISSQVNLNSTVPGYALTDLNVRDFAGSFERGFGCLVIISLLLTLFA